MVEQYRCFPDDELSMTETHSLNYIVIYTFSSKFTEGLVLKIMDFLKCSRASQWHGVPGCKFCKRVLPKRNAQKNILKKFIIQSSSLFHKMLVSNVDIAKCHINKILVSRDEFSK